MHRPKHLIGILGTHTEVGKTFVTAGWLAHLRAQGFTVAARKPVQSFHESDTTTDATQLAHATGEAEIQVCLPHRRYALAFAPPMAADALRRPRIEMSELLTEMVWPADVDVGVVETVGGLRSPLAHDGDSIELLIQLQPNGIVLVADAGLGTLNAVRLSLGCLPKVKTLVFLNRYDATNELHRLNRRWLHERDAVQTAVTIQELDTLLN